MSLRLLFSEDLFPTLWLHLAVRSITTEFIDHVRLNDIEYQLRIDITTRRTFPDITIHLRISLLEIHNGFYGITPIDKIAARIQDKHIIKHLIDF